MLPNSRCEDCQEKVQLLLIQQKYFAWHWCDPAGKESGLECTCGHDDFTVLVSGGSRHLWVSMCMVQLLHSKWLSKYSIKSASGFALSFNIPPSKRSGWFRSPQLWAADDWQLHRDNMPTHIPHLVQRFLTKHQIPQVTQPHYSPDLVPCNIWLFPKLNSALKGRKFQTIYEI